MSAAPPETTVTPSPDVIFTELHTGEGVLLQLPAGHTFTLNATAATIWQALASGLTLGEVQQKLRETFEVDDAGAEAAVQDFVADAAGRELLTIDPGT